ncbi:MAG: protein kinase [Parachlamydiales bacterium]
MCHICVASNASSCVLVPPASMPAQADIQVANHKIKAIIQESIAANCISASYLTEAQIMDLSAKFVQYVKDKDRFAPHQNVPAARLENWLHDACWIDVDGTETLMLIGRELGSGGQCTVFLGMTHSGDECAVKALNEEDPDPSRERGLIQDLSGSKHIIRRFASSEWHRLEEVCSSDLSFICDGAHEKQDPDALSLLNRRREDINLGILQGIVDMHVQGIGHFDIKLENILVSQSEEIKIADFGAAIRLGDRLRGGTFVFASPEQIDLYVTMCSESGSNFQLSKPQQVDVWHTMLVLAQINQDQLSPEFQVRIKEFLKKLSDMRQDVEIVQGNTVTYDVPQFMANAKGYLNLIVQDRMTKGLNPHGLFSDLVPTTNFEKLLKQMAMFSADSRISSEEALNFFKASCVFANP